MTRHPTAPRQATVAAVPDPRAPVLVGLGEVVRRPEAQDGTLPTEPAALMAEAVVAALEDAGPDAALLRRAGALGAVPSAAWPDGDPGRRAADILGVDLPTLRPSMQGGNGPQLLVNVLGARIQDGALDAAIVCGAEALSTLAGAMKRGESPGWPDPDPERRADEVLEEDRDAGTDLERGAGLIAPIMAYPLIENALRAASGRTPEEHLAFIASLWSRFSAVAAEQPAAWTPTFHTPEALATAGPANRRVTLPYLKLLNANIQVDMGAALVLCAAGVAEELGIPRERRVHLHAGARATDEWFLSERADLAVSPAIRACGEAVFGHTGTAAAELGPVDLYSCFPAAVELAAHALGLPLEDPARPLTCTGGLTFFGGPGNDYATHGIIAVARRLRAAREPQTGLTTALGWYATKHAVGLYGNTPPRQPFSALEPEPEATPARTAIPALDAEATAETCTLIYERDGVPSYGILFALTGDGRRIVLKTDDPAVMARFPAADFLGSRVRIGADGSIRPA